MIVALTGMMGAGKTTIGKAYAKLNNLEHIDLDMYIEKAEGRTISTIFQDNGESTFRKLEVKYLREIFDTHHDIVLSLGGGTMENPKTLSLIKKKSICIYLQTGISTLVNRLSKERSMRPVIAHKTDTQIKSAVAKLLKVRVPQYLQSHITVRNNNKAAVMAERIKRRIASHTSRS